MVHVSKLSVTVFVCHDKGNAFFVCFCTINSLVYVYWKQVNKHVYGFFHVYNYLLYPTTCFSYHNLCNMIFISDRYVNYNDNLLKYVPIYENIFYFC